MVLKGRALTDEQLVGKEILHDEGHVFREHLFIKEAFGNVEGLVP
jgi:hypothetical protein